MPIPSTTKGVSKQQNPFRVMVVDDSAVIRGMYARAFDNEVDIEVAFAAANGQIAINSFARANVDVVVLDIEMPVMDGLAALPKFMEMDSSVQVLMSSTLTKKNAEVSIVCMQLGAKDYLTKPSTTSELASADNFRRELVMKVRALGAARRKAKSLPFPGGAATPAAPSRARADGSGVSAPLSSSALRKEVNISLRKAGTIQPEILAIGSSTGGPNALFEFFKNLDKSVKLPMVVTQHMPPTFTAILAEHIEKSSGWPCKEAKSGDTLEKGKIYIAPGDFHMTFRKDAGNVFVELNQEPPENFCRPSVDPMLRSLVQLYGSKILMVMLTGMGSDGLNGSKFVVDNGGTVIAQNEETSVVWGMPGAVANAGLCHAVLPLSELSACSLRIIRGQS